MSKNQKQQEIVTPKPAKVRRERPEAPNLDRFYRRMNHRHYAVMRAAEKRVNPHNIRGAAARVKMEG